MKKINFAIVTLLSASVILTSCSSKDDPDDNTTTSTTSSTTSAPDELELNHLVVDGKATERIPVSYYQPGQGGIWNLNSGYTSQTNNKIGILCDWKPEPTSKTYNIHITPPENEPDKVAIKYNFNDDIWIAQGGTATLTFLDPPSDSAYFKFTDITFRKLGKPNKVISGWIGFRR